MWGISILEGDGHMTRIKRTLILALIGLLMLPISSFASVENDFEVINSEHSEGVLLVQFEDKFPEVAKEAIMNKANIKAVEQLDKKGLILVEFDGKRPIETVIRQLENMKGVVFAEPDYTLYPIDIVQDSTYVNPDDETYYDLLWGLNNEGQAIRGVSGTFDVDIDAPEAWDMTAGSNDIIVAVIDTAVDLNHPDLSGKIIDYVKFHKGREDKTHGTHVAGTIAANDNTIGVIGVAPDVKIMSLAFLGNNGGSTSNAIKAINYAKANGAHIINASWGGGGYSQALYDAIENFGGPFVAAAGNDGLDNDVSKHYPSSYTNDNIVSVAAIDNLGQLADFSNYGLTDVDIAAPGVDIASTYPDTYAWMSGTSMATPHVAGILALMKSYKPVSTTEELIDALYESGVAMSALNGKTVTGKMANAYNALNALDVTPPENQPPTVSIVSPLNGAEFTDSDNILFDSTINDEDLVSVTVSWTSNLDGPIGSTASFTSALSLGVHTIEVVVTDNEGLTDKDQMTITVVETPPNTPPSVTITAPTNGSIFTEGTIVNFLANATDAEDGDLSDQVIWTSDLDGLIQVGITELSVGTHQVTASVSDSGGLNDNDVITVIIEAAPIGSETSASVLYATEGGRRGDNHLLITILLSDGSNPVNGSVSLDVLLNGGYYRSFNGTTSSGQVTFKITKAPSGTYTIGNLNISSVPAWDGITPTDSFIK